MKATFGRHAWRHPGNRAIVLVLLLILMGLAVAPSAPAASPSASPDTTRFRVGWLLEPENLNPFVGLLG